MIPLYCVCTTNAERISRMTARFDYLGLYHEFVPSPGTCIDGHLVCLDKFLKTGKEFGIVCEDDIHIRRDFLHELPIIVEQFKKLKLDILLLGYLLDYPLVHHQQQDSNLPMLAVPFSFHSYGSHLWGTQMYLITRSYAAQVLHNFGPASGYKQRAAINSSLTPHASDHIITKDTSQRALIWPMLAVEEGIIRSEIDTSLPEYQTQNSFHQRVFTANYDPALFV